MANFEKRPKHSKIAKSYMDYLREVIKNEPYYKNYKKHGKLYIPHFNSRNNEDADDDYDLEIEND